MDAELEGPQIWQERFGLERYVKKLDHYIELSQKLQASMTKYPRLTEALAERTQELATLLADDQLRAI